MKIPIDPEARSEAARLLVEFRAKREAMREAGCDPEQLRADTRTIWAAHKQYIASLRDLLVYYLELRRKMRAENGATNRSQH